MKHVRSRALEVLDDRQLNRATLARQLLLEPSALEPLAAVEHLLGLQAQVPNNPHIALWSRLAGYEASALDVLYEQRQVVRSAAVRGTIHLLAADDCLALWPLSQPVLERELNTHRDLAPLLRDIDLAEPMAWARTFLTQPRTQPELKSALGEQFPEFDPSALAFACRNRLALVQVPPRGMWGRSHQVTVATAESWIGRPLVHDTDLGDVVVRYLRAFGPARPADMATWSRWTGLAKVFERLRPELVVYADERGREVFDLPDAPRPDPDTPAPVRFLPEYDNVLLSHDDRSRFADGDARLLYPPGRLGRGHVLVDGRLSATWLVTDGRLEILHLPLAKSEHQQMLAEAARLSELFEFELQPVTLAAG